MSTPEDYSFPRELKRKALHLLALFIPAGMLYVEKSTGLIILFAATLITLILDILRAYLQSFRIWINRLLQNLMRPNERPAVQGTLVINGSTWTLLSSFLLLLLFPAQTAALALVIFLLGDAAAGLVGQRWGQTSWRISNRTVEGSAAFLAVALLAIWLFPGDTLFWIAAAAALCASAVEILPGPLNDNLQVPVAAATVISILEGLFAGSSI